MKTCIIAVLGVLASASSFAGVLRSPVDLSATRITLRNTNNGNETLALRSSTGNFALDFHPDLSSYISVAHNASQQFSTGLTAEAWINVRLSSGDRCILYKGDQTVTGNVFYLAIRQGKLLFGVSSGAVEYAYQSVDSVPPNQWHHVAGVFDGSLMKLYLDGVLNRSIPIPPMLLNTSPAEVNIGKAPPLMNGLFDGLIDEVRLWNRALDSTEISLNMSHRLTAGPQSGLVGYWPFYDGAGAVVSDLSSNGNDGAIVGALWVERPQSTMLVPAAYPTIQSGINASFDGDTVLVAPGIYVENINFGSRNIVLASNYFLSKDTGFIVSTVIDGNNTNSVVTINGGQDSTAKISGFTIRNGNSPTSSGGGISCGGNAQPIIEHNIIENNHRGGGITAYNAIPCIQYNIIRDNVSGEGGGIYCHDTLGIPSIIRNNLIVGNQASYGNGHGGGLFYYTSSCVVENNTIVDNSATNGGGGIYAYGVPTLKNDIVWSNASDQISGTASVTYSDVQGGWLGTANIATDPLFVNPVSGNYQLQGTSPCINAGDPAPAYNDPDGTRNDMGAYYYSQGPYAMNFRIVGADSTHVLTLLPTLGWHILYNIGPQVGLSIQVGTDSLWLSGRLWSIDSLVSADSTIIYAGQALAKGADYYARVRLHDSHRWGEWAQTKFHTNSVPTIPVEMSPAANAILGANPTLTVQNSLDAEHDALRYDFRVSADSLMSATADSVDGVTESPTTTSWTPSQISTDNQRYWWRARAYDGWEYSIWTSARPFWVNTIPNAPSVPNLLSPPDSAGLPIYTLRPTFHWSPSVGLDPGDTVHYRLDISLNSIFQGFSQYEPIYADNAVLSDSLDFGTHYWWRVVAIDNTGLSAQSQSKSIWTWTLGDLNNSHVCDLGDLSMLVSYLTGGGAVITPKMVGDLNGDCRIDLGDLSLMVNYLTGGGARMEPGCQGPGQITGKPPHPALRRGTN